MLSEEVLLLEDSLLHASLCKFAMDETLKATSGILHLGGHNFHHTFFGTKLALPV